MLRSELNSGVYATIALLIVFFVFSGVTSATTSIVSPDTQEGRLAIMPAHYEPYPAESGKYVRVWIKAENGDGTPDQNVRFKLMASYPFSLDSSDSEIRSVGTIDPTKQVVIEYNVRVDSLALTGVYNKSLQLRRCFDDSCTTNYAEYPIEISVRRPNPIIDISSVTTPSIVAGRPFNVTLELNNSGSRVKDITIGLNLSSAPFGPLGSSTTKQIEAIGANHSYPLSFELIATGSATADVYKVPITISYSDEVGNSFIKSDYISLIVSGKPAIFVGAEDVSNIRKNSANDLVVSIVNKGLVNVKLLTISLLPSDEYRILSPSDIYIGSIDSDNFETAKFKIYSDGVSGQATLAFNINYMDALNNNYSELKRLTYTVLTTDEAVRFGLDKADTGWVFFVILGILVVFAVYRLKKRGGKRP